MGASCTKTWSDFKSPLRVVVQILLRSRETRANRHRERMRELDEVNRLLTQRERVIEQQQERIRELERQTQRLQCVKQTQAAGFSLPEDPPMGTHGYGPRMVSLAVNLARSIGLRGSQRCLKIVFEYLQQS